MSASGITLHIHPPREQQTLSPPASHQWPRVDGSPWMQRHDLESGSVLRLPGLADFWIDAQGDTVEAWPVPGMDHDACSQLYLSNAMPMALSRQGKLVLHASAVAVDGEAVVFVGVSGRGKSTLATSFARNGYPLLVDDGLVVEAHGDQFVALPGEQSVRLWRDSEQVLDGGSATDQLLASNGKTRIGAKAGLEFASEPHAIRAIFLLGEDRQATLAIHPLPPSLALVELIHYSFLLDVGNGQRHALQMAMAGKLAASCTISLLDYPREYSRLAQVRQTILDRLRGRSESGTAPGTT